MVQHIKEGQDRYGIDRADKPSVGAILHRATHPGDVDTWRPCHDLDEILKQDSKNVIYGSTESELESEIWKRHPVDGEGVALVVKHFECWEIERTPRLMQADPNLLNQACALHRRVLVGDNLVDQLGGPDRLVSLGFLLADRNSRSARLVRYNPRQVVVNRWRKEVKDLRQYLRPEFPPELMNELFHAVKPECWPDRHPYRGLLATDKDLAVVDYCRDSWSRRGRRRSKPVNDTDAPVTIRTFIRLARKLSQGEHARPWRRTHSWRELLERLVDYVHGVEANGNDDWKKLARWIRCEARAAQVKIPRRKKLPAWPVFGKKAAQRRHRPQLKPVPA